MNLTARRNGLILAALLLAAPAGASAHSDPPKAPEAGVPAAAPMDAAKVVDSFHSALASGDMGRAAAMLSEAVLIFEAGGAERSKSEYAASHLAADATFAKALPSELTRRTGGASADIAWVASEGRTRGRYKDRDVDQITTETMILRKAADTWRIVHVHWSSRAAAAKH